MATNDERTMLNEEFIETELSENNPSKDRVRKPTWKSISIGGVSGIALGIAGTLLSGFTIPSEEAQPEPEPQPEQEQQPEPEPELQQEPALNESSESASGVESSLVQETIPLATNVNDDMSFGEAFAEARVEVGASGAFTWHGQVYGTFYGNEWDQLSSEEKNQFLENVASSLHTTVSQEEVEFVPVADDNVAGGETGFEGEVLPEASVEGDASEEETDEIIDGGEINLDVEITPNSEENSDVVEETEIANEEDVVETTEIHVLNGDETPHTDQGTDDANLPDVDGNAAVFVEVPSDPITENLYADTPDYVNNADVSSFTI